MSNPAPTKLTDKQRLFCEAYLSNGFNLTQAAITAGYKTDNPRNIGAENYAKPYIKEYIQKRVREQLQGLDELKSKWIERVSEIAFYENPGLPEDAKYKPQDILKATDQLGKYLSLFTEKKEIEHTTLGEDGKPTGISITFTRKEQSNTN